MLKIKRNSVKLLTFFLLYITAWGTAIADPAHGGYLSFTPSSDESSSPITKLEYDVHFEVVPHNDAGYYYAYDYSIDLENGLHIPGYMGLQATNLLNNGTYTYVLATIWPPKEMPVNFIKGDPGTTYSYQKTSAEGRVATCTLISNSKFQLQNNHTYRITASIYPNIDENESSDNLKNLNFKISDITTGESVDLGTMVLGYEISGFKKYWPSHFLETFKGQSCADSPHTKYIQYAPTAYTKDGHEIFYEISDDPSIAKDCSSTVTVDESQKYAVVDFSPEQ